MTQKIINVGAAPNDGTGDPLRLAYQKTNDNFTELYSQTPAPVPTPPSTKAEFDAACTDGDFLFVGDVPPPPPQPSTKAEFDAACADGDFVYVGDVPEQGFAAFEYTFDKGTTEPVGAANIRFDNTDMTAVTRVWVHNTTSLGTDVSNYFTLVEYGMRLFFQDKDMSDQWVSFNCTGAALDKGSYNEFPVAFRAQGPNTLPGQRTLMNIAGSGGASAGASGIFTVATLPSATIAGKGARAFVTDATVTDFASIVAGGGSNDVPVYSDGVDWKIG